MGGDAKIDLGKVYFRCLFFLALISFLSCGSEERKRKGYSFWFALRFAFRPVLAFEPERWMFSNTNSLISRSHGLAGSSFE
jgi:hypothetical protein